ncbi:MAG: hypothetical protein RL687_121 [Candidatus Parcubacteria bacterium]|jgi:heat shock protein HslJ
MNKKISLFVLFLVFLLAVLFLGSKFIENKEVKVEDNTQEVVSTPISENTVVKQNTTKPAPVEKNIYSNTWVWQKTVMSDDAITNPSKPNAFTLTFSEDGKVSGTTDCNNMSALYRLSENNSIQVYGIASTKMFCENSQEKYFTDFVDIADKYMFSKNGDLVLLLPYDSGSMIFKKK